MKPIYFTKNHSTMKKIIPTLISFNHLKAYLRLSFILTFVTLLLMLTPYLGQAQISQGGAPLSFTGKMGESYPIEVMPSVDIQAALKQDALDDEAGGQPYRFGINIPVNINVLKQGETQILAGGNKLIRQGIRASGAITINLTFSKFRLPKGAKLFIYNKDKTHVIGAFTDFNNQEDHKFGTILIKGDEITLEYFEPANAEFKTELTIGIVTHGYKDAFGYAKAFGSSGSCETNVNCPAAAGWECEKRSVVMLVVGSNGFCTGALVNNTNQNKTPYVLTANHCLSGVPNVSSWVFYFNWESATCANPATSPTFQSMSGATLKANNGGSDFALVQINTAVPDSYNATYAGWSRAGSVVSSSYGIHHPRADIKKFSASENPTLVGGSVNLGNGFADCWQTGLWTLGVTEPGSSGSPLFDPDHLIIGQLYGGPSSCTTSAANKYDYYGKFHVSWSAGSSAATRLKDWLDPTSTDPSALGSLGCAPPPTCDAPTLPSVSNITISGATVVWTAVSGAVTYKVEYKKSSDVSWTLATAATASTSFALTGLTAGTPYNVRVTTKCASLSSDASPTADFMTVCNMTASAVPTPVSCFGGSNGSINLTITSGTPAFSFDWGPAQPITEDRTGLVAGTYSVTATDANGCTASTSTMVNQPTALTLTTTQVNVTCSGDNNGSIDLTVSGGVPGYTYNWGIGQPTTQDRTNLIAGSYTVTVTDANGCTASKTIVVSTINTLSTAPTSISGISTICNGGSTTLTLVGGSAGTGAIAEWSASSCSGTVIGTGNSITVSPSSSTTYFVKYNGTCNTTTCASQLITVNTLSTAPLSISGTSTICNGGSTTLTLVGGSAGTGATVKWYSGTCGGTPEGTGNSITVSPTTNTTYFVRYEGTCNTTACASQLITVNTLSTTPSGTTGITNICLGNSTTLTLSGGFAGTGAVAEWFTGSCGGALAGTGNSIIVAPTVNTTYYVRYKGTCNTTSCASVTVTITTPSVGGTVAPAQSQGCGPQTVNLSVSGINGTVTNWERQTNCTGAWTSIGFAGLNTITVTTPNSSTCYRAVITNGGCASANSTVATITIDKPAVGGRVTLQSNQTATSVALCPSENTILIPKNYVGKVANWQYTFGTSPIWYDLPGTEGQTTLTVNGSSITGTVFYRVVIVTELGICTGLSSVAYSTAFRITTKLSCLSPDGSIVNNDIQTDQRLTIQKVYPNPASNVFNLEMNSNTEGVSQIEIIDVTGRQVLNQTLGLSEGFNTISLDISKLSRGVFIVKITDSKNQKAWVKMVKE